MGLPWDEWADARGRAEDARRRAELAGGLGDRRAAELDALGAEQDVALARDRMALLGAMLLEAAATPADDRPAYLPAATARRLASAAGLGGVAGDVAELRDAVAGLAVEVRSLRQQVADLRRENWELATAIADLELRTELTEGAAHGAERVDGEGTEGPAGPRRPDPARVA